MDVLRNDLNQDKKVEVRYEINEDEYIFEVKLSYKASMEFAVLFVEADGSFYTAKIVNGNSKNRINIKYDRLISYVMLRIVNIEDDSEVFVAYNDFLQNSSLDVEKNDKENIRALNDVYMQVSEEDFLKTDISLNEDKTVSIVNSSLPEALFSKDDNIEYKLNNSDRGRCLLNDAPEVLKEVFEEFTAFKSSLVNHDLYVFDRSISMDKGLAIKYNARCTPLSEIFADYVNPFIDGKIYPKELVGKASRKGVCEYFVFARLGRHLKEEQPFAGATGFVFFHELPEEKDGIGYWMSYISASSGNLCMA